MRRYKYIGHFKSEEGHEYSIHAYCNGFLQAFFCLTADAIRSTRHYQLYKIVDEEGNERQVTDIQSCMKCLV